MYIELQKFWLDQIAARNIRISLENAYSFLEVNPDVSEETRGKANMIPVKRIYLLYLQTVLIIVRPGVTIHIMQVNNMFTVNVIFCPSKANSWRLKLYLAIEMSQKTWQIIEVSNSTKRHADNSGNQADL